MEAEVSSTLVARPSALVESCCIWAAIWTRAAEVSSVEVDWVCAPRSISSVAAEICSAATASPRDEVAICVTSDRSLSTSSRIECSSQPTSSRERLRTFTVRSPFAMVSAATPRSSSRRPIRVVSILATHRLATMLTSVAAITMVRESRNTWSTIAPPPDPTASRVSVSRCRNVHPDASVMLARKSWARRILRPIGQSFAVWRKRSTRVKLGAAVWAYVTSHLWRPGAGPSRAAAE